MKIKIIAAAILVAAGGLAASTQIPRKPEDTPAIRDARALVAAIQSDPGWDRQNCGLSHAETDRWSPYSIPRNDVKVTPKNFALCRAQRASVIAVIREGLAQDVRDALRCHGQTKLDGYDTYEFTQDLAILIDLNGVEALPELLELAESVDDSALALARCYLLSTITAILRQERFAPLLESSIEKEFHDKLEEGWSKPDSYYMKPLPEGAWRRNGWIYDPVYGKPRETSRVYIMLPLDDATVAQVVKLGRRFLAETKSPLAAAGMDPWPTLR